MEEPNLEKWPIGRNLGECTAHRDRQVLGKDHLPYYCTSHCNLERWIVAVPIRIGSELRQSKNRRKIITRAREQEPQWLDNSPGGSSSRRWSVAGNHQRSGRSPNLDLFFFSPTTTARPSWRLHTRRSMGRARDAGWACSCFSKPHGPGSGNGWISIFSSLILYPIREGIRQPPDCSN